MSDAVPEKPARGWRSTRSGDAPARGSRRARIQKEKEAIQREAKSKQLDEFKTYLKDLFPGKQKYYAAGVAAGVVLIVCFVIWQLAPGPTVDRDSAPRPESGTAWTGGGPRPSSTYTAPRPREAVDAKK